MTWSLRTGVAFCRPGDRTLFLDVPADRYFCLTAEADAAFVAWVGDPTIDMADLPALAGAVRDGLLVARTGPPPRPCSPLPTPEKSYWHTTMVPGQAAIWAITARLVGAELAIRTVPLARILDRLTARKRRLERATADAADIEAVAAALRDTSSLVSPLDRCLPRSLATAHRLLDRRALPQLVIGVKLGPFEAHAWVQHDTAVVNDTIDHVRRFTPILIA